jgi:hypothetical protein
MPNPHETISLPSLPDIRQSIEVSGSIMEDATYSGLGFDPDQISQFDDKVYSSKMPQHKETPHGG